MKPVHFSQLKHIGTSPAHYRYRLDHPPKQSEAMRIGSAVDAMLFETEPVLVWDGTRRGKPWDDFAEEHSEAIILNKREGERALACAESIRRHEHAMDLLQGERQRTVSWSVSGRPCEGRVDVFTDKRVVELKTGRTSHPDRFVWNGRSMNYHTQLAWYWHGLVQSGLANPQSAHIVAAESVPPFPVTCFELTEEALDQGERTWRLWLEHLLTCEASNQWPAYAQCMMPFDVPDDTPTTLTIGGEDFDV